MIRMTVKERDDNAPKKRITSLKPAILEIYKNFEQEDLDELSALFSDEGVEGSRGHDMHCAAMLFRKKDDRGLLNGAKSAKMVPVICQVLREHNYRVERGVITGYLTHQSID